MPTNNHKVTRSQMGSRTSTIRSDHRLITGLITSSRADHRLITGLIFHPLVVILSCLDKKKCGIDSTRRAVSGMYRVGSSRDRNHIEPATTTDFEGFRALSALWSILGYFGTHLRNPNRDPERMGQQKCGNAITFLAVSAVYRVDQTSERNRIELSKRPKKSSISPP